MVRQRIRRACFFSFVILVALALSFPGTGPTGLHAQPPRGQEIYQDFRGSKPLTDEWKMIGLDREAVIKPEGEGLRITLAKKPKSTQPVGVRLMFPVSGDFEITGSYQFLSADPPPAGGTGVGVAFNLVAQNNYKKFVKLGRFVQAKEGNTYIAESWRKDEPKDYQMKSVPTAARSGQLRLVREGSKIRYLVADDPPNVFREIHHGEFTDEDLEIVRIGVNNNGSPASVDVRLVDLKIRFGNQLANQAGASEPPVEQEVKPFMRSWLAVVLLVGFAITLIVVGVGLFLVVRLRRRPAVSPVGEVPSKPIAAPTSSLTVACPECGKNLKFKAESAGKKIKCSQCGNVVLAPPS